MKRFCAEFPTLTRFKSMYLRTSKPHFDSMHEECGVFGVYSDECRDVAATAFYGLYALQHRGQESAGIAVTHNNRISCHRGMGLVPEVFTPQIISGLPDGDIAIGHVRYSTTGEGLYVNAQPLVFTGKPGRMALAHNGNIINTRELRDQLIEQNVLFQTTIDSEVIAALINREAGGGDIVKAIISAASLLKGSFTLVIMTSTQLIGVRDGLGMRPLVLGKHLDEYILASETCALDAVGAEFIRDIQPGEVVVIDSKGPQSHFLSDRGEASCIFEYVYFSRPDSIIDGCSVYEARKASGRVLAEKYPVEADLVSGVPDSAVVAARGYSEASGIPYAEALAKNRYVGRTFIQPTQHMRELSVNLKMNALKANVNGKRLVLVDDSIVRGTTSRKIIDMLRRAGAKEIHLRISSPIIKYPCYFGLDTQTFGQLIGSEMDERQICDHIGADSLKFLTIDELVGTCKGAKLNFCLGCFSGKYPMPVDEKENSDKFRFDNG